jgi:hypothetical protein
LEATADTGHGGTFHNQFRPELKRPMPGAMRVIKKQGD